MLIESHLTDKSEHDTMVFALTDAMGWDRSGITEPMWGELHAAAKTLTQVGADPSQVASRAAAYQLNHPTWPLTPSALAKWWADSAEIRIHRDEKQIRRAVERRAWRAG